ncbi:MAG: two component transcriptional regulator, LuxR family [Solirubrobacterales bacterium]|nr:two component transcriptional regulator, LuxR family [Solirubrobacterales bacterium]
MTSRAVGHCVLVVADDEGFRATVADLLANVGLASREAMTGEAALIAADEARPDVVVLETLLPGMSGYELCHELRARFGNAIGLVFASATRTESGDRVAGLLVGADDYMVRPFAPDESVARVRRLLVRPAAAFGSPTTAARLTRREREVLSLLIGGESQAEIARTLSISSRTVAKHVEHLVLKLGARNRAHAVGIAVRNHLTDELDASTPPGPAASSQKPRAVTHAASARTG